MKLTYQKVIDDITPPLYDLEIMFWIVVAKDLFEKYGDEGEKCARYWIRKHAGWRGQQIRKGNHALGLPINVQSMYEFTDNPINNAFTPMWKYDYNWTPYNVKLKVSPGECVMYDRMVEHEVGLIGDVFCDELHQSFTTTYHPDATVVVPEAMSKGDDHCMFRWVLPGDAEEPEPYELYSGEDVEADWKYDDEDSISRGGVKRLLRWYGAQIFYLNVALQEFFPESAESEFNRLIEMWEVARARCIIDRKGEDVLGKGPEAIFKNFDTDYYLTWDMDVKNIENGIEIDVRYCPFYETWNWIGNPEDVASYCDTCYDTMAKTMNSACEGETLKCKAKGDSECKIRITIPG